MKVLIIEDESRIAKRLERMIRAFFLNTLQTIMHAESLDDGLNMVQEEGIDILLLDLNLNGENGFKVLEKSVAKSFHTIIVSANKKEALTAFSYGVLDFVAKPFDKKRLEQALNRAVKKEEVANEGLQLLVIKKKGNIKLVKIEEVLYMQGAGVYTELCLRNGQKELHDKSLEKLAQLLPKTFIRLHKSYLVKISEINEVKVNSGSKYEAVLNDQTILPIGRTRYKHLKERMH
ncbi:LytTR family DNA-binding domain-containing protein [uncultured Croceitalea sp.]|uniref:LytR/AlgR family response regulator transcription factor n=1 Tax=uncultured Croceitalea sp. TaxID=1798908 RepID=UPI00330628F6